MGKLKEFIIDIVEQYQDGMEIQDIAVTNQIPATQVEEILRNYGGVPIFPSASEEEL